MQRGLSNVIFLAVLAAAAVFVWQTGRALPDVVAAHFTASGNANGFMPRVLYVRSMLVLIVVLPVLVTYLSALALRNPKARINLPNREYWLAPPRRAETIETIRAYMQRTAMLLVVLLAYMHWLVARANQLSPPNLPEAWFIGGLAIFVLCMLAWAGFFIERFRNIPR